MIHRMNLIPKNLQDTKYLMVKNKIKNNRWKNHPIRIIKRKNYLDLISLMENKKINNKIKKIPVKMNRIYKNQVFLKKEKN